MNASREAERKNLTTLTLQSDAAMKALQRTKEKVMQHTYWVTGVRCMQILLIPQIFYKHTIVVNNIEWSMNFQGERILTLAEMCRKLETEEEKVLGIFMCTVSYHPSPFLLSPSGLAFLLLFSGRRSPERGSQCLGPTSLRGTGKSEPETLTVPSTLPSVVSLQVMQEYGSLENFWKRYNKVCI